VLQILLPRWGPALPGARPDGYEKCISDLARSVM
jgi:hypothetical protein